VLAAASLRATPDTGRPRGMELDQATLQHLADDTGLQPSEITKSGRHPSTTVDHLAADTGLAPDEIEPPETTVDIAKVASPD
jgi:hypothetical protein